MVAFFSVLCLFYYWNIFIKGLVPFPGDLLVGAYFPWMDYKWGYEVGVPVKNALISDIFSQFFIWKSLIAESFRAGQWPLWNPYSYSGYPLLANYNSGALNPFNFLMVFLGDVKGWSSLIVVQTIGSLFAMYAYLRNTKLTRIAGVFGAVVYAFGGFAVCWQQFVNVGFIMLSLPLTFLLIDKYLDKARTRYLVLFAPLVFLIIVAGHFQGAVYAFLLFSTYFLVKLRHNFNKKSLLWFSVFCGLGIGLSAAQLLPTMELGNLSVRYSENYIENYNYGLLPLQNILAFFVPDYFGNPTTGNYWGPFNYHETVVYVGTTPLMAMSFALRKFRKLADMKFFLITAFFSLVFLFDTPAGRLLYDFNVPLLSTSAAGRVSMVFAFCAAVLCGWWIDEIRNCDIRKIFKYYWWWPMIYVVIFGATFGIYYLLLPHTELVQAAKIGWRNTFWPGAIMVSSIAFMFIFRQRNILSYLLLVFVVVDLFRFGWKYTPFVPDTFIYPQTSVTDFLTNQEGVYRIEREKAQILPPNTWASYRLSSPSGYDPMAVEEYSAYYNKFLNNADGDYSSRYSELEQYSARRLGEFNVKYFLAINRNTRGELEFEGTAYHHKINSSEWKNVFKSSGVTVFENIYYKPRVEISEGSVEIVNYSPGEVKVSYESENVSELLLRDYFYPGWTASSELSELPIQKKGIFMSSQIPAGKGEIVFKYSPEGFRTGLHISLVSLIAWIALALYHSIGSRLWKRR